VNEPGIIYGHTVAKALVLLDQAEIALVRVAVSRMDCVFLSIDPKLLRPAIAAHPLDGKLPAKYDMNSRIVELGTFEAILKEETMR
jgi:hypothetical protein